MAEASTASARLAASGMPPSPTRRANQAGASTPKPPAPARSAITAAGPSHPASTTAARGCAEARGDRQQQPDVQCREDEHEQVRVAGEREPRAGEQRDVRAEVAAGARRVGIARDAAGGERSHRSPEREREDDLPQRHPAARAGERRRVGVGQQPRRALQADREHAERHPGGAPEHAPQRDRGPRAARSRSRRRVDEGEDRRDQERREEELERPAAEHAIAGDEVRRAEVGGRRPGVERERRDLHGGADASEAIGGEQVGRVDGRALAGARAVEADDRRPAADERGLVSVRDGGHERRDLLAQRGQRDVRDALAAQRLLDRAQPSRGRQPVALARDPEHQWPVRAPDRPQGDAGPQREAARRVPCELARARGLRRRAVDRGEHQRRLRDAADERARELDERSRARAVVVRARPREAGRRARR